MNPLDDPEILQQAADLFTDLLSAGMNNPETVLRIMLPGPDAMEANVRAIARYSIRAAIWFREEVNRLKDTE